MAKTELLISLDDDRIKYLSDVITNKTCKKILEHLSENSGTVTDVSEALKIKINTVDYNIKKLLKAGLIEKKSFFWSVKGKKMPTYIVSNKKIVLQTKKKKDYVKYLYAFIVTGLSSLIIRSFTLKEKTTPILTNTLNTGRDVVLGTEDMIARSGSFAAEKSSQMIDEGVSVIASGTSTVSLSFGGQSIWMWFLFGAWATIFIFFVISLISERRSI